MSVKIRSPLHLHIVRNCWTVILFLFSSGIYAQQPAVKALPDFVLIPAAADRYEWTRVLTARDRIIFNNSIAVGDSTVWSFGGFNTERVLRVLLRIEGNRLVADSIRYPGTGFMNGVFFAQDSALYTGGGLDSGAARYSFTDFWRYDLRSRSWSRLRDLPFYNIHPLNVFESSGRIFVLVMALQGADLKQAKPLCYEYLPARDEWRLISQKLPLEDLDGGSNYGLRAAAFCLDGEIYTLFQPWETQTCLFAKLNPESGAWTRLSPFPGKQQSFSASFAFSDGIFGYVGGGRLRSRADNSREVFRYDPVKDRWERIADLPQGLRYGKGWMQHGRRFVGFGINDKYETVMIWELRRKA